MKSRIALILIAAALMPASRAASAYDDYFPFKSEPSSVLEKALGPAEKDVSFVINEMPVDYRHNSDLDLDGIEKKLKDAQKLLSQQAVSVPISIQTGLETQCPISMQRRALQLLNEPGLSVAQEGNAVRFYFTPQAPKNNNAGQDLTVVLDSLAVVNIRQHQFDAAEKCLLDGLREKMTAGGPDNPHLLPNLDYLAQLCRLKHDYGAAEQQLKNALEIRQKFFGADSKEVAANEVALACLCHDAGQDNLAEKWEQKAKVIVADTAYVTFKNSSGPRPVPSHINPPTYNEWPQMIALADGVYSRANQQRQDVDDKVAALKGRLQITLSRICQKEIPAPILTVQGTLLVSKDALALKRSKHRSHTEKDAAGVEYTVSETADDDNQSDVENQPVMLCAAGTESAVLAELTRYARQYNLSMDEFGQSWPSILAQATTIKDKIDGVAQAYSVQQARTTKTGDFEFQPVPKGNYYVYSSIANEKEVLYWLIGPIAARQPSISTQRLSYENVKAILWRKGGSGGFVTARGGRGSGGQSPPTYFVPAPPP